MIAADRIAEAVKQFGIERVFGIPGKESARLAAQLQQLGVTFVQARHETQAVMMADGYWRVSGRVGVVLLAQGPGLANAVNGLACAAKARSGIVVIVGDLLMAEDETEPHAAAVRDLKGINQRVVCEGIGLRHMRAKCTESVIDELLIALQVGRSGQAVCLSIPSRIFESEGDFDDLPASEAVPQPMRVADSGQVQAVVDLLDTDWAVRYPVVLAGRGAVRAGAIADLIELADHIGAILCTTLPARSAFAGHPYNVGVCGSFCSPVASVLLSRADCVLAFGASLNPLTTYGGSIFRPDAKIVQIDIDPSSFGKYTDVILQVEGDARLVARDLLKGMRAEKGRVTSFRSPRTSQEIAECAADEGITGARTEGTVDPRALMIELNRVLPRERIVALDAGLHLFNTCTYVEVDSPGKFVFPIETISIGLGLGAAIGASFARPGVTVMLGTGDCGFMMSINDLDTAVRYHLPIIVVVSNDGGWGAEAQHLQEMGLSDSVCRITPPSFASIATAMGATGYTVRSVADLLALTDILQAPLQGPIVLDCFIDPTVQSQLAHFDYAGVRT